MPVQPLRWVIPPDDPPPTRFTYTATFRCEEWTYDGSWPWFIYRMAWTLWRVVPDRDDLWGTRMARQLDKRVELDIPHPCLAAHLPLPAVGEALDLEIGAAQQGDVLLLWVIRAGPAGTFVEDPAVLTTTRMP
jgi:hypothetical protein